MFDVLVYRLASDSGLEPTYLLEVDRNRVESAIKYLKLFRVKRQVYPELRLYIFQ